MAAGGEFQGLQYRCQTCGQGWRIAQTDRFNNREPRFCPVCGHAGKINRASSVMGTHDAACFSDYNVRMVELMYQVWASNPEKIEMPDRFIDYLKQELD